MTATDSDRRADQPADQLALVDTPTSRRPVVPEQRRPTPAPPAPPAPVVEPDPVPEVGVWRRTGRPLAEPAREFTASECTGDHGLCGVCTGGRCEHDPDPEQQEQDQQERQDPEDEEELEP